MASPCSAEQEYVISPTLGRLPRRFAPRNDGEEVFLLKGSFTSYQKEASGLPRVILHQTVREEWGQG